MAAMIAVAALSEAPSPTTTSGTRTFAVGDIELVVPMSGYSSRSPPDHSCWTLDRRPC